MMWYNIVYYNLYYNIGLGQEAGGGLRQVRGRQQRPQGAQTYSVIISIIIISLIYIYI